MTDILVIEDNEELGGLIQYFMRREGYSVEWKMNAEEGLALVKTAAFKLLLLDVMLPGMDGYEVLQEIRRNQRIPVLMMSARTDDQSKILGLELGRTTMLINHFLLKCLDLR